MKRPLYWILGISVLCRLILVAIPQAVWWDTAVYVGMAKYIYSAGHIGFWESLRPPLWPIIIGPFIKLGLPIIPTLQILEIIIGCGAIALIYSIGERISKHLGLYAAIIFSFTPFVFFFTSIPLSDLPSMTLGLFGLWLILNKRFYIGGLILNLTFLMRFPMGLFLVVACAFLLSVREPIKYRLQSITQIILGFLTLLIPYFIINFIQYGDVLQPLKDGGSAVNTAANLSLQSLSFYLVELIKDSPLFVVGIIGFIFYLYHYRRVRNQPELMLMSWMLVICGSYFSLISHKELRYSTPFLPAIAIFTAYGLSLISSSIASRYKYIAGVLTVAMIILLPINANSYYAGKDFMSQRLDYYSFLQNQAGARVVTSSPPLTVFTNVLIIRAVETWETLNRHIDARDADYIAFNSCELSGQTQQTAISKLQAFPLIYSKTFNDCQLAIYKVTH